MNCCRVRTRAAFIVVAFSLFLALAAPALAAPPEVSGVGWCGAQKDCLLWSPTAGALKYLVYRGETATLPCALSVSFDSCDAGRYSTATTGATLSATPAPGSMFWYLVTAADANGEGTPGAGTAGPRALNSIGVCASMCSPVGTLCGTGSDCCTGACNGGVCEANCCAPQGGSCQIDNDCCTGTCANGTCQGECRTASECPGSDTECATRTCTQWTCGTSYTMAGTPTASQTSGDCQSSVCDGAGTVVQQQNNSDIPDDGLQCTFGNCINGVPSNTPAPMNLACSQNGGVVCNANGQCVQCNTADHCPGSDTDCANRVCVAETCGTNYAPEGTVTGNQSPGDCQTSVCDGFGGQTGMPDNGDVPNDGSQCTSDMCMDGVPTFSNQPAGAPCAENGGTMCDGLGRCVQCVTPQECPGTDGPCAYRTCNGGMCGFELAPAGSQAPDQIPGDCQGGVCDGNGNVNSVPDNTDVPNDGAQCTQDVCIGGVPSFPPLPVDSPCDENGGVVCSGFGTCVQCNSASQCPGVDMQCSYRACNANLCQMEVAPIGTPCTENGGTQCDGAGTCIDTSPQVLATNPANGAFVVASTSIAITFSTAMNPATLTGQTAAGPCAGSIQVSLDNFASCVAFSSAAPAMSSGDTVATLVPAPGLLVGRNYRIRVTTAAQSSLGAPLATPYTQPSGFNTQSPSLCDGSVVISQTYGAGGQAGATYRNDFVELHNRGTAAVSVNGWSIQYASSTGTTWLRTNLAGTINPGRYYLVQLASGGTNGAVLPTADATGTTDISAANGKLALVSNQTTLTGSCPTGGAIVDFVGYGTANCSEGGTAAPAGSLTSSVTRQQIGCADIDTNNLDFVAGTPTARNSASSALSCQCYVQNEIGVAGESDYCVVQFPSTLSVQASTNTGPIYGQLYEAGITEPPGGGGNVRAQLGYGPPSANPQYQSGWTWRNAAYNVQVGNNDEYQASFTAPPAGSYRYVYRFSLDSGVSWTYCDTTAGDGGAGSNVNLTFDLENQGVLTTTP